MRFLFENFALDADRRELLHGSLPTPIEPQVFDLLEYLIRNRNRVVSKDDLLAAVWHGRIVSDSTLASRINAARRAIRDDGKRQRLIRTMIGRGVRFTGMVTEVPAQDEISSGGTDHHDSVALLRAAPIRIKPSGEREQLSWSGSRETKWATTGKKWTIEGRYVEYCSCDVACPCFSMGEPNYGHCTGLFAFKIDNGCCETVRLDDLAVVVTFYFPQALHHGQGVLQPFIDQRADPDQRQALLYILSGEDQPVGSVFQIFSAIAETMGDPLFAKIDFEWDIEKRHAKVEIGNIVRAHSAPTRNPITGEEQRMITVLPNGWIFREGETVSGFAKGRGAIKFNLFRRHSSLARIFWTMCSG